MLKVLQGMPVKEALSSLAHTVCMRSLLSAGPYCSRPVLVSGRSNNAAMRELLSRHTSHVGEDAGGLLDCGLTAWMTTFLHQNDGGKANRGLREPQMASLL